MDALRALAGSGAGDDTPMSKEEHEQLEALFRQVEGRLSEHPTQELAPESATEAAFQAALRATQGKALAVALLTFAGGEAALLALADEIDPPLGELISLEELGADAPGWALVADVGTGLPGLQPACAERVYAWVVRVLQLMKSHPRLGATIHVDRGFFGPLGPVGPAIFDLDAGLPIIPRMCLLTEGALELVLGVDGRRELSFRMTPVPLDGGPALARVALTAPTAPPIARPSPALVLPRTFARSPSLGVCRPPSSAMVSEVRSSASPSAEGVRAAAHVGIRAARPPVDPGQMSVEPRRQQAYRSAAPPPQSAQVDPVVAGLPSAGGGDGGLIPRESLSVYDVLKVDLQRRGSAFTYLLTQTDLDLRLEREFRPVSQSDDEVHTGEELILSESARYLRVVTLTSDRALTSLDRALSLVRAGETLDIEGSLAELRGALSALQPGVGLGFVVSDAYEVRLGEQIHLHPSSARITEWLGSGRFKQALELAERSCVEELPLFQRAELILLKGKALRRLHRRGEARGILEEAASLAELCGASTVHADALREQALYAMGERDYDTATRLLGQAERIARDCGDKRGEIKAVYIDGMIAFYQNELERALDRYREVEAPARRADERGILAASLHGQGSILMLLGRFREATRPLRQASDLFKELKDRANMLRVISDLANVLLSLGEIEEALSELDYILFLASRGSLDVPPAEVAIYQARHAVALHRAGRTDEALEELAHACAALRESGSPRLGDVLVHQAEVALDAEELGLAREVVEELRPLMPALAVDVRWRAALVEGALKERLDQPGAEDAWLRGVDALEAAREHLSPSLRSEYLESSVKLWDRLIRFTLREGTPLDTLRLVERMRARWFQEALLRQQPETAARQPGVSDGAWVYEALDRIVEALPAAVAILELHGLPDGVLALFVQRGEVRSTFIEVRAEDLATAAAEVAEALACPPTRGDLSHARLARLADLLLEPCWPWIAALPEGTPLGIVANGALHQVPFQALPCPDAGGRPLTLRNPVFYAPSLKAIGHWLSPGPIETARRVVALANPQGDLPGAEDEARGFLKAMGGAGATSLYLGGDATTRALVEEAPSARLLHLACHALGAGPTWGAHLQLARPSSVHALALPGEPVLVEPADGRVGVEIITRLGLKADLVTLAACESDLGDVNHGGEGADLLSWAFLMGGARSVVACGWKVGTRACAEIMKRFYENLQGGDSKVEALAKAQSRLIHDALSGQIELDGDPLPREFAHPHHWAGFSLAGVWR